LKDFSINFSICSAPTGFITLHEKPAKQCIYTYNKKEKKKRIDYYSSIHEKIVTPSSIDLFIFFRYYETFENQYTTDTVHSENL
jgi:hypothetical protein